VEDYPNPSSLMATVIQAKYFPHGNFLKASLGNKSSFAWRSMWNARELLSQGLLWRVGDGQSSKIWGDCWIPTPTTYKVQFCPCLLDRNSLVSSLIDPISKSWK
jgi:hypothetical protein